MHCRQNIPAPRRKSGFTEIFRQMVHLPLPRVGTPIPYTERARFMVLHLHSETIRPSPSVARWRPTSRRVVTLFKGRAPVPDSIHMRHTGEDGKNVTTIVGAEPLSVFRNTGIPLSPPTTMAAGTKTTLEPRYHTTGSRTSVIPRHQRNSYRSGR